jgi:hypothetical protein
MLWLVLRVTFLYTVWKLGHRRHHTNKQFTAASVVRYTRTMLERAIRGDFLAASQDLPRLSGLGHRWFRGKRKQLTLEDFTARWCVRRVLASIQGPGVVLAVHIPSHIPP